MKIDTQEIDMMIDMKEIEVKEIIEEMIGIVIEMIEE